MRVPRHRPIQPLPTQPPLRDQMDLSLEQLAERVGRTHPRRRVYPYVVATVKSHHGKFAQTGGSPNFQGGFVTLCDCKHHLRSFRAICDPGGVWIAGITGPHVSARHRRYLYFLMYAEPVCSHAAMWHRLPESARAAKSAARDPFGDLYEPTDDLRGEAAFHASNYRPPIGGHVHGDNDAWRIDIEKAYGDRRPCLLLGVPRLSFIWSRPGPWLVESRPLPRPPASSEEISAFLFRLRDETPAA